MKKVLIIVAVMFGIWACDAKENPQVESTTETIEEKTHIPAISADIDTTNNEPVAVNNDLLGMPNPFLEFKNIDDAAKTIGFGVTLPSRVKGYYVDKIMGIQGELLQVFYINDNNKDDEIVIRKARGVDDIKGDYMKYTKEEEIMLGGVKVWLEGDDNVLNVATWSVDDFSYAIMAGDGVSRNQMLDMVKSVH